MSDHSQQADDAAARAMMDNLYWWGIPSLFRADIAASSKDVDIDAQQTKKEKIINTFFKSSLIFKILIVIFYLIFNIHPKTNRKKYY